MVVNLENAFRFPLKDKRWFIKILIGGLLMAVPIVNFFTFGYLLKILADAKDRKEPVLHEWNDWTGLFREGFMMFVVAVCYMVIFIPLFVLSMIPFIGYIFKAIAFLSFAPVCITALCLYIGRKELSAAFDFRSIIEKIKANVTDYLILAIVIGVAKGIATIPVILAALFLGAAFVPPNLAVIFVATTFFIVALFVTSLAVFYVLISGMRLYGEIFSAGKTS